MGRARFPPSHRTRSEPLRLFGHEVAWGRFEDLEAWCVEHHLPFARCSGACSGAFGAERVVFRGEGEPQAYAADEKDEIVINAEAVRQLGSFDAILSHLAAAEFAIPPMVVTDDEVADLGSGEAGGSLELSPGNPYFPGRRIISMQTVSANDVAKSFGRFSRAALREPLTITHHGADSLVLMSHAEYERLTRRDRRVMTLADFTDEDRAAVAAAQPHPDAEAFNHEMDAGG